MEEPAARARAASVSEEESVGETGPATEGVAEREREGAPKEGRRRDVKLGLGGRGVGGRL